MAKILVCDRCGFELTERDDINKVLEGSESWQTSVQARGLEARGVYPCKHFVHCQGEMVFQKKKRFWQR
jgi:hypothetical protein